MGDHVGIADVVLFALFCAKCARTMRELCVKVARTKFFVRESCANGARTVSELCAKVVRIVSLTLCFNRLEL